jgi:hypothetical protein
MPKVPAFFIPVPKVEQRRETTDLDFDLVYRTGGADHHRELLVAELGR